MGWTFRKSLNVGGGLRINLSKHGIGASTGVRGFRVGLGPRGKRLQISIPGTGISYRKDEGWNTPTTDSAQSVPKPFVRLVLAGVCVLALGGLLLWSLGP